MTGDDRIPVMSDAEPDLRTIWAADRTVLAGERTYAAWVRTALAALVSGIGARAVLADYVPLWMARLTGSVLVLFAGFCLIFAVWRTARSVPRSSQGIKPLPLALLLPVNLFLVLVAATVLVGIWRT